MRQQEQVQMQALNHRAHHSNRINIDYEYKKRNRIKRFTSHD